MPPAPAPVPLSDNAPSTRNSPAPDAIPGPSAAPASASAEELRRRHFGHFYGLDRVDDSDSPFVVVHGNCQAGSIRRLLESAGATAVRIPPVHELTEEDAPLLHALVSRADVFVSQPIGDGYHGLKLGSAELSAMLPAHGQSILFPVLRFAGLFPFQVTVRPKEASSIDPPGVPYHDLRTIIVAHEFPEEPEWTASMNTRFSELTALVSPSAVRALAAASVEAMRVREDRHGAVQISSILAEDIWSYRTHHTLNHPTNAFVQRAAEKVIDAMGWNPPRQPQAPDHEMLGGIRGRVETVAAEVFPVEAHDWTVGGDPFPEAEIRRRQLAWYRENPLFIPAGLDRHAETLNLLGLPR